MQFLSFLLSSLFGFFSFKFLSHPNSSINKRLPTIKIKIIQIIPTVKVFIGKRYIHLHHWLTFSILLIVSIKYDFVLLDSIFSKGLLAGGVVQGLTYSDWKKIIKKEGVKSLH